MVGGCERLLTEQYWKSMAGYWLIIVFVPPCLMRPLKKVYPLWGERFTGSLKVIRRAVPLCQENLEPELDLSFSSWILAEIGEDIIPPRQNRSNPRVVKKPRSKFKSALPKHRGKGTQIKVLNFQGKFSKSRLILLFFSSTIILS